jgi:uncharacterized protein YegP (UPF0339 family)
MANESQSDGALTGWYRDNIADPQTNDEVLGYWLFLVGIVIGASGLLLFPGTQESGVGRQVAIAMAAFGLLLLLLGPTVRLPLQPLANRLAYSGAAIGFGAVLWFFLIYPAGWSESGNLGVMALYAVGMFLVVVAGGMMPYVQSGRHEPAPSMAPAAETTESAPETTESAPETDDAPTTEESSAVADDRAQLQDQIDTLRTERDRLQGQLDTVATSMARFELYTDNAGEYRWRLRHRNGNVIADSGEGYTARHNAQKGLQSVRRNAYGAALQEIEPDGADEPAAADPEPIADPDSQATVELYADSAGEYRWRLVHDNGNIIADCGEGYSRSESANDAIATLKRLAPQAAYLKADPTAFEIYADKAGEFRWRLIHRNGDILADGGEGYSQRSNARRAVDSLREHLGSDSDTVSFDAYTDNAGEHRWRLVHDNGNIIADSGEGYASESGAEDAIDRVREYAPDAAVLDIGQAAFEIYEDDAEEYRWRLRHRNGNILADSGEGYSERRGAEEGIESVKRNAPGADVDAVEA